MNTAMILAAGRGERLKPLTNSIPKALCKVHHIPLIEYHVINLSRAGFKHIVINHAYLGGQIRQHLGLGERFGTRISYAPEPPGGLETGGGIVNALPLLGKKPFVTVNADIFTDFPFANLSLRPQSLLHLVLVPKPSYAESGDFGFSDTGEPLNTEREYTFPGIACYDPMLFKGMKLGRFSVTPILRKMVTDKAATAEVYLGKWLDIGTSERLAKANL
jgi:MurNAc alpha-1-phosphate uridylyltransferase